MKYKLIVFIIFITVLLNAAPPSPAKESSSGSTGNVEYSVGGGYYLPTKVNSKNYNPEAGYTVRLQNGNGEANYFNLISNLEFQMTGDGHDDFKDINGNNMVNVRYNYYSINYHLGFRFNVAPESFILPYFGASAVVSVTTFQFAEQTSTDFPESQRGFMYGGDLFAGIDLYISGNKDKGWGLRFEGDVLRLFPYTDFALGTPEIYAYNLCVMFVSTY
jgi:hypothetical protein